MPDIHDARILILATDGFEEVELTVPLERLSAQGASVHVVAPDKTREAGSITAWDGAKEPEDWGHKVKVDRRLSEVRA